jgi:hypothetical protein
MGPDCTVQESNADVKVNIGANSYGGGLVGANHGGTIITSYATGRVGWIGTQNGYHSGMGGLVGFNEGAISNSYANGGATGGQGAGGLVGGNDGDISDTYSTGAVTGPYWVGGLIGADEAEAGDLTDTYWDMDTSGVDDPSKGAGTPSNDPGITGVTTEQLRSGLPSGFDPSIWGESADINNGLPYLLANPPEK